MFSQQYNAPECTCEKFFPLFQQVEFTPLSFDSLSKVWNKLVSEEKCRKKLTEKVLTAASHRDGSLS